MTFSHYPAKQGLYDPAFEKDSCGVGFVANIKGRKSHDIVRQGLEILVNLDHRGATGSDPRVGDGAGVLVQIPDAFLREVVAPLGFSLPKEGRYGVGMLFLPQDEAQRAACESVINDRIVKAGQTVLGWRTVPTELESMGTMARETAPYVRQVFVGAAAKIADRDAFDRKLYLIRREIERGVESAGVEEFYVPSMSCKTMVYKGLLTSWQVEKFYPDLLAESFISAIALVHARYSTNTFPSWDRAQPCRVMAHNGEINTLRGNVNWMAARESQLSTPLYGDELQRLFPIVQPDGSDSAIFDNVLEFLMQTGRRADYAMLMMIPEAWDGNPHMTEKRRAFFQYHATLMEPWDGPAAIAFSDGSLIGATLDRNGLRPARIWVTSDDRVIMASETGVLPVEPQNVVRKMRLQPGRIFAVDTSEGRILSDEEVKERCQSMHPYQEWLEQYKITLDNLREPPHVQQPHHGTVRMRQQVFGYTKEDLRMILAPMAENGQEPVGSMGMDNPVAVLSNRPHLLFDYFKQNFAQVTNPPIDPIREEMVMSLGIYLGREGNILVEEPTNAHVLWLSHPVLTNYDLEKLRHVTVGDFQAKTLPILFPVADGHKGLQRALEDLKTRAEEAVNNGYSVIILTDRGVERGKAPIPSLLATAAVHHHLIRKGTRNKTGIIVETGEAREVHHFALLVGFGATAVNPYLAFETLVDEGTSFRHRYDVEVPKPIQNYIKAVNKGLLKIMSKMGISTVQSYHGAQIFEALGLNKDVVDRYFTWTPTRIEGIGLEEITEEVLRRHAEAFRHHDEDAEFLDVGGIYKYRRNGEYHQFNPRAIGNLQRAVRSNDLEMYKAYANIINVQNENLGTLRGLFRFKANPIPLEEVEPAEDIVTRFATGAMSLGALSREAHETLAIAMNRIGGRSNSGEGGEDPARFTPDPDGSDRISKIKQVASGRFGVNSHYLVNAQELQIKMAQGAKPGEGGQLPGHKVDAYIGRIRFTTPGVGLISPPPHHDIYSIEDLKQLIFDLKNSNPEADVSVKLVSETGVGTVAAGVSKAKADMVLIAGHDGGTGASPLSSVQHAGMPWEIGLAETQQTLVLNDLRGRIRVQTDGQLKTGRDVAVAALLGAEEFGFSTAPLVSMGCIMMRVCHLNTCPVGVATQDPRLRKKFPGAPEHVVRFFMFVAQELRELMAHMGFRTINEMVGRVDCIDVSKAVDHWKAHGLDFTKVLYRPQVDPAIATHRVTTQDHGIAEVLDLQLIEQCKPALEHGTPVELNLPIRNSNLTTGTMLGSRVSRKYGADGLPDNTIRINFSGSAGQSFGAFLPRGITLTLRGDTNDYAGKGLSGGRLIVCPPEGSTFAPEENIVIGNVVLYGATAGEAFFSGMAGERFCVRNSGAYAVVEGVGDHGCEYMTGGRVVVLGATGSNFAAGMSGGVAYVLDEQEQFAGRCNLDMVNLEALEADDRDFVYDMVSRHVAYTDSPRGKRILEQWDHMAARFVKVMPIDYKRILLADKAKEIA